MNSVSLVGNLTRDPEVRHTTLSDGSDFAIARYTLAVSRRFARPDDEVKADFISCKALGKSGEFAEKYLTKGMKMAVTGRIETGNYVNKDGVTVYTTEVVVDNQEFCQSKTDNEATRANNNKSTNDSFMSIPDKVEDEGLPFF